MKQFCFYVLRCLSFLLLLNFNVQVHAQQRGRRFEWVSSVSIHNMEWFYYRDDFYTIPVGPGQNPRVQVILCDHYSYASIPVAICCAADRQRAGNYRFTPKDLNNGCGKGLVASDRCAPPNVFEAGSRLGKYLTFSDAFGYCHH